MDMDMDMDSHASSTSASRAKKKAVCTIYKQKAMKKAHSATSMSVSSGVLSSRCHAHLGAPEQGRQEKVQFVTVTRRATHSRNPSPSQHAYTPPPLYASRRKPTPCARKSGGRM